MNKNSDVKIFKRGAKFVPWATSIPDYRVAEVMLIYTHRAAGPRHVIHLSTVC